MNKSLLWAFSLITAACMAAVAQPRQVEAMKDSSVVTYRMVHPLHEIEAKSKEVIYRVRINPAERLVLSVAAEVDVTTFDSGNSNRDSHAMEVIDAITYPDAVFTGTSITQQGDSLHVAGKLTFHGVTKEIVVVLRQEWNGNTLHVTGGWDVSLTAFKIERPSLLMIPVEDNLHFSLAAVFAGQ